MKDCPNCHQSLHVSHCQQASLLYCTDCQWGVISFDEELDTLMEMEHEEENLASAYELAYLSEAV